MSNTIVIQAINQIQVNGGSSIDPVVAINSGTCLLQEWYAALQVWFARQLTSSANTATEAAQAVAQTNLAAQTALTTTAQQTAQTAQASLATLQGQVNTLVPQFIAATLNPTSQQSELIKQVVALTSAGITAAANAQIAEHQAAIAQQQAIIASVAPTTT